MQVQPHAGVHRPTAACAVDAVGTIVISGVIGGAVAAHTQRRRRRHSGQWHVPHRHRPLLAGRQPP